MARLVCYLVAILLNFGFNSADWSYTEVNNWKDKYPDCGGRKQSPIDIITSSAVADSSLVPFQFSKAFAEPIDKPGLTNTGNSYQVDDPQGTRTASGGGLPVTSHFKLEQFHLHLGSPRSRLGSEHKIDNKQYPGEMHLVFVDRGTVDLPTIAVLGLFIDISIEDNNGNFWKPITEAVASANKSGEVVSLKSSINLSDVVEMSESHSSVSEFYRYNGSLTTPPCTEGVIWTVFQQPTLISRKQYDLFFPWVQQNKDSTEQSDRPTNNFRPLMELNSRTVYKSRTSFDNNSSTGRSSLCSFLFFALVLNTLYSLTI